MNMHIAHEVFNILLYIEPEAIPNFPFLVVHPVIESNPIYFNEKVVDIFQDSETFYDYLRYVQSSTKDKELNSLLLMVRKQFRLFYIYQIYKSKGCTLSEAADLFIQVWQQVENIGNDINVSHAVIRKFINYYAKHHTLEERELLTLPEVVTIYRGCTPEGKNGFCWTLTKSVAEFFANRFDRSNTVIYKAEVRREDIVTHFLSEDEIVVDYKKLMNVEEVLNG